MKYSSLKPTEGSTSVGISVVTEGSAEEEYDYADVFESELRSIETTTVTNGSDCEYDDYGCDPGFGSEWKRESRD